MPFILYYIFFSCKIWYSRILKYNSQISKKDEKMICRYLENGGFFSKLVLKMAPSWTAKIFCFTKFSYYFCRNPNSLVAKLSITFDQKLRKLRLLFSPKLIVNFFALQFWQLDWPFQVICVAIKFCHFLRNFLVTLIYHLHSHSCNKFHCASNCDLFAQEFGWGLEAIKCFGYIR